MVAGLLVGAVLCAAAEPDAPKVAPGAMEGHRDALARYGAALWNLRRERLLTAARQLESAAQADPDATEPLKQLARLYAQLGREPDAIRTARKVIAKDPSDFETAALLARLLCDAGELKEAAAAAKLAVESKALAEKPADAVRVYRDVARLCERANDLAGAEAALRKAIEMVTEQRAAVIAAFAFTPKEADGEAADCLERLGHVLVKRAKYGLAAEAFAAAAKLYADPRRGDDPASAARLDWNLSGALEAKGDHEAALKRLEEFLKLRPRNPEPYQRLARLLAAVGRRGDAVPALQALAEGDPRNRPLAAVLAAEMARDPESRAAADRLFASLTSVTTDPVVIGVVVKSHLDTGRVREIIKDLDRAFTALDDKDKKEPETPVTVAAKAFAADKARAYADALEGESRGVPALLRAADEDLRAGAKHPHGTYSFLGTLAFRHRKIDLAVVQFRQSVRSAPKESQVDAYRSLIQVLWLAGKPLEVELLCRDGLADPDVMIGPVFFNFHRALALAELGRAEVALAAADQAIRQAGDTDRLTVRLNRHKVLCVLGKWAEAIEYGKKLAEEFDAPADRPRMRHAQATAYSGAKKLAEAEAVLRAILDDDPDDAVACNDLGYHLADEGRNLDEAEQLVRHALGVDRVSRRKSGSAELENAAFRDSLGWVLFRQGKLADARAELEQAAALPGGATDPTVWDHLGDVLFRLNEKSKAKAAWERAKELYDADARISSRGRRDGRLDEVKRKLTRVAN